MRKKHIILRHRKPTAGRCCGSLKKQPTAGGEKDTDDNGFTLIELLIAMAVAGIVLAGIYTAYNQQMKTFNTQERIVGMHQNARVALFVMEREIRMAGLDSGGDAGAGITVANGATMTFSLDFTGGENDALDNDGDGLIDEGSDGIDNDGDGLIDEPDEAEWYNGSTADANEQITYVLSNDADGNGQCDGLPTEDDTGTACNLMRNGQRLASNIDVLNFVYLGVDPTDASCEENCPLPIPVPDPNDIRSVQITLIARSGATVPVLVYPHTDDKVYYNQPPANQIVLPVQNDSFRRIRLTAEVRCRNLGL